MKRYRRNNSTRKCRRKQRRNRRRSRRNNRCQRCNCRCRIQCNNMQFDSRDPSKLVLC